MNQLVSVICDRVMHEHNQGMVCYDWAFNPNKVPSGVISEPFEQVGWYHRNVHLKHQLHRAWNQHPERRAELERYYIADWGGVRGNRDTTLHSYQLASADENIARVTSGIASWSKALCIRDPFSYAIFDARVSASLNALQIIHLEKMGTSIRFPLLASRNSTIQLARPHLQRHFEMYAWPKVKPTFYSDYLRLCRDVAAALSTTGESVPIYTFEMALFANTEKLLGEAFPDLIRN